MENLMKIQKCDMIKVNESDFRNIHILILSYRLKKVTNSSVLHCS